uniref:CSON011492 protein n=1 Tax=Culicoides sonorensis TaxID=179676 RepID=A0A336LHH8_CULSO
MSDIEQTCISFFIDFAKCVKLNDQLPVNMAGYNVRIEELFGEVITWSQQYLLEKNCPVSLLTPIIEIVKCKIEKLYKIEPSSLGYDKDLCFFNPLKLMQRVISELNEICIKFQGNESLKELLLSFPEVKVYPKYAVSAVKNTRKKMEDRHICINDFNRLYSLQDKQPMSFYAIFDGHGGTTASSYCAANFHNFLSQNFKLAKRTDEALRETFLTTDEYYTEKSVHQCFTSGTCALCVVYKIEENKLFVGWVGDSQALLVKKGKLWQIVQKHSPSIESEKKRIEELGGVVLNYGGIFRVQGQLSVSRAIGPATYKPFVSSDPDICCIELDGEEDFLILGCDGLWDNLSEDEIAITVYRQVKADPIDIDLVTKKLVEKAKAAGSTDNITVIVVFLKNPIDIADLKNCNKELNKSSISEPCNPYINSNESREDLEDKFTISKQNVDLSLKNRILDELQLQNPDIVFEVCESEITVNNDREEDEWDFIKVVEKDKSIESNENQKAEKYKIKMSSEILNNDKFCENQCEIEAIKFMSTEKEEVYKREDFEKNEECKLNPRAKEFIPCTPGNSNNLNKKTVLLLDDPVVAQSPKSVKEINTVLMDVPTEVEFEIEISKRPHETEDASSQNLNSKEAAQSDEKLEEGYMNSSKPFITTDPLDTLVNFDNFNDTDSKEQPYFEENSCEELNKIQPLPITQEKDIPAIVFQEKDGQYDGHAGTTLLNSSLMLTQEPKLIVQEMPSKNLNNVPDLLNLVIDSNKLETQEGLQLSTKQTIDLTNEFSLPNETKSLLGTTIESSFDSSASNAKSSVQRSEGNPNVKREKAKAIRQNNIKENIKISESVPDVLPKTVKKVGLCKTSPKPAVIRKVNNPKQNLKLETNEIKDPVSKLSKPINAKQNIHPTKSKTLPANTSKLHNTVRCTSIRNSTSVKSDINQIKRVTNSVTSSAILTRQPTRKQDCTNQFIKNQSVVKNVSKSLPTTSKPLDFRVPTSLRAPSKTATIVDGKSKAFSSTSNASKTTPPALLPTLRKTSTTTGKPCADKKVHALKIKPVLSLNIL